MGLADYLDELNLCDCLFLEGLEEPRANELRLLLKEGRISRVAVPIEVTGQSLGEGYPVEFDDSCASYELIWDFYVLYQITNESFGRQEACEEGTVGKRTTLLESSALLDYALRSTLASNTYPGKLLHFRLVCSDHVIDVISTNAPEFRRIGSEPRIH
jgi:hypothetical protein